MADPSMITSLIADRTLVCAGEPVQITATVEPQGGDLTWSGDLGTAGDPQPPEISSFSTNFGPGEHVITATAELNEMSITVRAGRLSIEFPSGAQQAITDAPEMPSLNALVVIEGGVPTGTIEWTAKFSSGGFDFEGCPNAPSPFPGEFSKDFTGTGQDISIDLDERILGGSVAYKATTTFGDTTCVDNRSKRIKGTNPEPSDIQAALPHDTLRRIACKESKQRQFDIPDNASESSCPVFSNDGTGRAGVMQIPNPTLDEVWHWRVNVDRGIGIFNENIIAAGDYPDRIRNSQEFQELVDQFNLARQQQGLNPIQVNLPDFTTGNFDDDLQQLELDAVRGYNGWFGQDRFGFELHEFKVAVDVVNGEEVLRVTNVNEQTLEGEAAWERVPIEDRPQNIGDPNYVNNVISFTPACLFQPVPQPPPASNLTGPTQILRGTNANYQVVNVPAGATFGNWTFVGGGVTVNRPGNNNVNNWQGIMVQSGTVSVDVTTGGVIQTLSLAVVVAPRPWTENVPTVPLARAGNGTLAQQPRSDPDLGITIPNATVHIQSGAVNSGPNQDFNLVLIPPVTWTVQAFSNDALFDSDHPFFRAHNRNPLPTGRIAIGDLLTDVEAHEGIITPPTAAPTGYASHWQRVRNHLAIAANQINIPREGDVTHVSNETTQAYSTRVRQAILAGIQSATAASAPHPQRIFGGTINYNYPFIFPRSLSLSSNQAPFNLTVFNPAGGTVWSSGNPNVVEVDASGVVTPVAPGSTTIEVTNADGDVDEISINVTN